MSCPDTEVSLLAALGSLDLCFIKKSNEIQKVKKISCEKKNSIRCIKFSDDGKFFSYALTDRIIIMSASENYDIMCEFDKKQAMYLSFSPKSTILSAWSMYEAVVGEELRPNLELWNIEQVKCVGKLIQKNQLNWEPMWSSDESICIILIKNEICIFKQENLNRYVKKLPFQKVINFSLSSVDYLCLACFIAETKSQPSFVRVVKLENELEPKIVSSQAFFQKYDVSLLWNSLGNTVLILLSTDKSADSYYGEQMLCMANIDGLNMVVLDKSGPIYAVKWHPLGREFCVVYGFMPSSVDTFNLKGEMMTNFGTGPRNDIYYNPFGNMLAICGFGSLKGYIEIWDVKNEKQIAKMEAPDTTYLQWNPSGTILLTAITSPRLKVGNGFKLWHYSGSLLFQEEWDNELLEIIWKPVEIDYYQEPAIDGTLNPGPNKFLPNAPKPVYLTPAARARIASAKENNNAVLTSQKNKKKKEAKKIRKQHENANMQNEAHENMQRHQEAEKRIKKLHKELKEIERLKQKQNSGESLDDSQLAKLSNADLLLQELKHLQL